MYFTERHTSRTGSRFRSPGHRAQREWQSRSRGLRS